MSLPDRTSARVNLVLNGVNDSVKPRRRDGLVENLLLNFLERFLGTKGLDEVSENDAAFLRVGEVALDFNDARLYPNLRRKCPVNYYDGVPKSNRFVVITRGALEVDDVHFVRDDRDLV